MFNMKENQFFISCPDLELLDLYNLSSSDKLQCNFQLGVFKVLQLVSWSWVLDPSLFDPRWHCLGAESGIFSREMRGKITILNSILASPRWKKLMMHSKNVTICRLSNLAFIQTGIQTTIRFLFGSVDRSINIFYE